MNVKLIDQFKKRIVFFLKNVILLFFWRNLQKHF